MFKKFNFNLEKQDSYFLLFFNLVFLALYFCLTQPHLDSPGDMVENYAWGINWAWGNNKHPPLSSWVAAGWFYFFPTKDWSYYVLSALNMFVASIFLILALNRTLERNKAFIALALTIIVLPLSIDHGYKYNANLAQLPFLTSFIWALIKAVQSQKKIHYFIAGLFAGAALLCKYSAILLLGPMTLAVWIGIKPEAIRFSLGLLIAALAASMLFMPHVYWEIQHHWPSLNYMQSKSGINGWDWFKLSYNDLPRLLKFFSAPVLVFIFAIISTWPYSKRLATETKQTRIGLTVISLSLFLIYLGAYIEEMRADPSWFIVCTIFFGWTCVDFIPPNLDLEALSVRINQLTVTYLLIALISAVFVRFKHQNDWVHLEALPEVFAHDLTKFYHDTYHQPMAFVGGSHPLAYDVTFYAPDHPIGFWGVDIKNSPWLDLNEIQSNNKIIVCSSEKHFFPKGEECLAQAAKLFGQPIRRKEFAYKGFVPDSAAIKLVKYDVLIYGK